QLQQEAIQSIALGDVHLVREIHTDNPAGIQFPDVVPFNPEKGKPRGRQPALPERNEVLAESSLGSIIALRGCAPGRPQEALWFWDRVTGNQVGPLPAMAGIPDRVLLSPDGEVAILRDPFDMSTLRVLEVRTGRFVSRLTGPGLFGNVLIGHAEFSPDGALFAATGYWGGKSILRIWDIGSGIELGVLPDICWDGFLFGWSKDGRLFTTMGGRRSEQGNEWDGLSRSRRSFIDDKTGRVLASTDTKYAALWEIAYPIPTYAVESAVQSLTFHPNGSQLIVNDTIWTATRAGGRVLLHREPLNAEGLLFLSFAG